MFNFASLKAFPEEEQNRLLSQKVQRGRLSEGGHLRVLSDLEGV